ncbi:DUF4893 domain-containing protein [Brevundimonas goettingensis]|jgi:hypothetical protein|uniref:DUF4893 domain-containing protein n=1 Tax=Brevundimonas goettingensis TaxID=2774190 RepID=A0A975GVT5_9CAUL|nr:DUF4893 domain-containing protein [Brevundimonas goettingensis]QTC90969.1 DUF4893 domain-containing protein [Brevundimonas goettingensis]
MTARPLIAVAGAALVVVACSRSPSPSTEDPQTTPQDGVTPPASAPHDPAAGESLSGPTPPPVDPAPPAGEQGGAADWRQVAKAADASALGRLDQAWRLGRAEAEDKGFADQVEALGPLVDPNAALTGRLQPPPGNYRCRTIKLGSRDEKGPAFLSYPAFRCTVELTPGGDLILTKTTGSQRSRGLLYPHSDNQLVFLGAQAWGDETAYPTYGQTRERDQIGVLERLGPQRWRLVIPWPKQEAKLEILELTR